MPQFKKNSVYQFFRHQILFHCYIFSNVYYVIIQGQQPLLSLYSPQYKNLIFYLKKFSDARLGHIL